MPPRIAITMGDPAGIGPEICLRLLQDRTLVASCIPFVIGDASVLSEVSKVVGLPFPHRIITPAEGEPVEADESAIIDLANIQPADIEPGKVSAQTGAAAYDYVSFAIDLALAGQVAAVTTGPIHKEAFCAAGARFPGHTELFADRTQSDRICMMLTSDQITCSFVTAHVGLQEVSGLLSPERILDVINLSHDAMSCLLQRRPRLVVCGLNPHAGEHGLFGAGEEERIIAPAIARARATGIDVRGPVSPDTAFLPQQRDETDCFVCMYHDQGLIPLKALAFDVAVNVTLGIPLIRTSVDHGTALDIAWQGIADYTSLRQAVRLASRLAAADDKRSFHDRKERLLNADA